MGIELKALLVSLALALGVAAPLPDLIAGLIIGLLMAYASMLFTKIEDRMTLWASLFAGLAFCLVAAIAHPFLPFGIADWPLQLVMAMTGFSSRWLGGGLTNLGKAGAARASKIPGDMRLPWGKD